MHQNTTNDINYQTNNIHRPKINSGNADMNQPYQAARQLNDINEILSKSKAAFIQPPRDLKQKIFPEDPKPPPTAESIQANSTNISPKVVLSPLKDEDAVAMQRSLSEFAMNSPDLARKFGVIKDEQDAFSAMKATGKRIHDALCQRTMQ